MADHPTSNDDIIDSRDVIARIEELELFDEDDELDEDDREYLKALKELADEAEGYGDWSHGETLIRHSHFVEYAEQLAEDIGAVSESASWPNNCIDWDQAAEELKVDYMSVDFDGVEYWMRA